MNSRFVQSIHSMKSKTEARNPLIAGTLGITISGVNLVEVPDRPSYVYVQVRSSTAEVIQAFNSVVSPVYGLPVMIQWQGNRYVVMERDTLRYSNWVDSSAYLPRHASTHEWSGSAGDVVFVSQNQFLPLMPMPSGSLGNTSLIVNDYSLMTSTGSFQYFPAVATPNLTVWNPSSPTGAIMVLVSLDAQNGSLTYTVNSGTVFGNWLTGTADILPKVPSVSDIGRYLPIAAVRLVNGTSVLTWDNIYDLRQIFGASRTVAAGAGGGGTAGLGLASGTGPIWLNNGVFVATGTQINLLGSNFTLGHSGTEIQLTIIGGGGASGSLLLDTSNGPLHGPLVVYQKFPGTINQYFDYSTIVGFLSGTPGANFAAAGEFVNWSTGSRAYSLYADEEGGGLAFFAGAASAMDVGPMVQFSHNIDFNMPTKRYFNDIITSARHGGGGGLNQYVGNHLTLQEADVNNIFGPSLEVQSNFTPVTDLFPMASGRPWSLGYPFPGQGDAAYGFDTARDLYGIITGTAHTYWSNLGTVIGWLNPAGDLAIHQLRIREYAPAFGTPPVSGSFAQGVKNLVNGTFTVPTTAVTMSSRIYLTIQFGSGTHVGNVYVYSRSAGSGFTVRSSDLQDNSLVAWLLVEPS